MARGNWKRTRQWLRWANDNSRRFLATVVVGSKTIAGPGQTFWGMEVMLDSAVVVAPFLLPLKPFILVLCLVASFTAYMHSRVPGMIEAFNFDWYNLWPNLSEYEEEKRGFIYFLWRLLRFFLKGLAYLLSFVLYAATTVLIGAFHLAKQTLKLLYFVVTAPVQIPYLLYHLDLEHAFYATFGITAAVSAALLGFLGAYALLEALALPLVPVTAIIIAVLVAASFLSYWKFQAKSLFQIMHGLRRIWKNRQEMIWDQPLQVHVKRFVAIVILGVPIMTAMTCLTVFQMMKAIPSFVVGFLGVSAGAHLLGVFIAVFATATLVSMVFTQCAKLVKALAYRKPEYKKFYYKDGEEYKEVYGTPVKGEDGHYVIKGRRIYIKKGDEEGNYRLVTNQEPEALATGYKDDGFDKLWAVIKEPFIWMYNLPRRVRNANARVAEDNSKYSKQWWKQVLGIQEKVVAEGATVEKPVPFWRKFIFGGVIGLIVTDSTFYALGVFISGYKLSFVALPLLFSATFTVTPLGAVVFATIMFVSAFSLSAAFTVGYAKERLNYVWIKGQKGDRPSIDKRNKNAVEENIPEAEKESALVTEKFEAEFKLWVPERLSNWIKNEEEWLLYEEIEADEETQPLKEVVAGREEAVSEEGSSVRHRTVEKTSVSAEGKDVAEAALAVAGDGKRQSLRMWAEAVVPKAAESFVDAVIPAHHDYVAAASAEE